MIFLRLYKILTVFRAYRLDELIPKNRLPKLFNFALHALFWVRNKSKGREVGERLCLAMQELGPVSIKLGQMLSTRRDILPLSIANALSKLQDQVAPFDGDEAKTIIESALGEPITKYFSEFNQTPLASASIAQVHTAVLKRTNAQVIIKVLRPNILPIIQSDIKLMYWIAKQITKRVKSGKNLHAIEIVREYESTLLKELDFEQEAYNTNRLRANFIHSDILYIPFIYQDLCRKNILVEERITGVPIADIEKLKSANVNMKTLAERGVQAFFTQVFRDNFFHADMHPGNIFIDINDPEKPRYIGIDCAIVGILSADDQRYLAENFLAFFNRDYRKIAETYIASGWVPRTTDVTKLEVAMRDVCEPAFAKPLVEISFAQILLALFQVARQFDMDIQPQLILLEKTLFYIEGIGRQLYPELDLWATAKPFLESWYEEKYGTKKLIKQIWDSFPQWRTILPNLPERINTYHLENKRILTELGKLNDELKNTRKNNTLLIVLSSLSIGMSLLILAAVML